MLEIKNNNEEPYMAELYFFALKSPVTRDKYKRRLENFFNFIDLGGTSFQEKCDIFSVVPKWKVVNGYSTLF